jgi:predicted amidohydrolase
MPKELLPRKIVVGSLMHAMYSNFPGVEKRCGELAAFIDEMAKQAKEKYGKGLDIAALPEVAVNGGMKGSAREISQPLEGPVLDILGAAAKRNNCYVTVPLFYSEDAGKTKLYNILALVDRQGKVAGIYKKVYAVGSQDSNDLEGGILPGKEFPLFECDFGKLGLQICYDMSYDAGWETLAKKGAELVIWSTQSPQIIGAQCRAKKHHYYLLSSTWRNNISLIDPTGARIAFSEKPSSILVEQIDLSFALVDWQGKLGNGQAFVDKYGKAAVGFRYSEAEDGGIFWSNDPNIPVMKMVRELGLELPADEIARNKVLQDKLRGGPPSLE